MSVPLELLTRAIASAAIMIGTCIATDVAARHMHSSMGSGIAAVLDTGLHGLLGASTWLCVELIGPRVFPSRTAAPRTLMFMDHPSVLMNDGVAASSWKCVSNQPGKCALTLLEALRLRLHLDVAFMDALLRIALCGAAAALLDVDHFVAAASVRLNDAMTLSRRPFGHALPFVVVSVAILRAMVPNSDVWLLLAVAWGSHHMRDSIKRGLWIPPFGSTPRIPYAVYCAVMALVPLAVHLLLVSAARGQSAGGISSSAAAKEDVSV